MKQPDDIQKKNPFKVPESYFETLAERTITVVKESDEKSADIEKGEIRRIKFTPFLALAAAIMGFAVLTSVMVRLFSGKDENMLQFSENAIYSEAIAEEIDTYMIEDALERSDEETDKEQLPDEAIIEYLLLENIEITDIYEILQ